MPYQRILAKGKIANLDIKNRIVCMPVGAPCATLDGQVTDDFIAYYEERAKGGAGLIITGVLVVDNETGVIEPYLGWLTDPRSVHGYKKLTDAIHKYDTKIFAQIYHPGKETHSKEIGGRQPLAPCVTTTKFGEMTHAMTVEEIHALTKKFASAAEIIKRADFDGVEIHCAHGYLLNDFISPSENHRTDEYGGTFENRMRFPAEVIQAVRRTVGPNFPISVRFSADEFIEGGVTQVEGIEIAKYLEALGVDCLDVTVGTQKTSHLNREPASYPQGWKKYLAAGVKANVRVPVIAVNTVKRPDFAETLLAEKVCDFVGLARGHLADPYFAEKVRTGRSDEIRTCISCLVCFETLIQRKRMVCSVNPCLQREREFAHLKRNGAGRKIAVVGGGPGGMQAAIILARRGFSVTLYEEKNELGGQLNYANKPPKKEKITWLRDGMAAEARHAGVQIILGVHAVPERVKAEGAECVFLASGSEPVRPNSILGINGKNVFTVPEVLTGKADLNGKHVVIIGSGLSGLETAVFLAARGCRIDIVELLDEIGKGIYGQVLADVLKELRSTAVEYVGMYPNHRLMSITPVGVHLADAAGTERDLAADAVVLSMGVRPRVGVAEAFERVFDRVIQIGDAAKGGRIADAIRDGFTRAWVFEP